MNDSSLCDVDLDIRSVRVRYAGRMVGTLALTADGVLAFEYDDGWIREGFSISAQPSAGKARFRCAATSARRRVRRV